MARDYSKAKQKVGSKTGKPVRPPFGYYGAKQRLARRIADILPPHNAWVEMFCGSAALTLAKPPAQIEVINDLDGEVANLFRQLRDHSKALCEVVALTPYAMEEFEQSRARKRGLSNLERARRFLVRTMMTVNGTVDPRGSRAGFSFSQSYSRAGKEARVCRWYNLPDRLTDIVERLRGVRIERRDARDLLAMFSDRPATLTYLDPPYFTKREHRYVIDAEDREFHEELLSICTQSRCMILLSGYDNKLYESMLVKEAGWSKRTIETSTRDTSGTDYARTEVLWTNPQYEKALSTGRIPVRLSKTEREQRKVNPSRTR